MDSTEPKKYDVFISYSRKDTAVADQICRAFDEAGITYFIDRQGIGGGLEFPTVLANAILGSRLFLYLASENAYQSKFTGKEVTFAFNKMAENCLLPYIIDGSQLPSSQEFIFSSINWRNMREHPIDTVLVPDLLRLLDRGGQPRTAASPEAEPAALWEQEAVAASKGMPKDKTQYKRLGDYKFIRNDNPFTMAIFSVLFGGGCCWGFYGLLLHDRTWYNVIFLILVGIFAFGGVVGGIASIKEAFPKLWLRLFYKMKGDDLIEVPGKPSERKVVCRRDGRYGIMDIHEVECKLSFDYDLIQAIDMDDGRRYFRVYQKGSDNFFCGLCDGNGIWVAEIEYAYVAINPEKEDEYITVSHKGVVQKGRITI